MSGRRKGEKQPFDWGRMYEGIEASRARYKAKKGVISMDDKIDYVKIQLSAEQYKDCMGQLAEAAGQRDADRVSELAHGLWNATSGILALLDDAESGEEFAK